MKTNEENLLENWNRLMTVIDTEFSGTRRDNIKHMYETLEERMIAAPASGIEHYHNCFAGGYVDHVLRVLNCSIKLHGAWSSMGANVTGYSREELLFAALNHDLGKVGDLLNDYYVPNPSDWHRKNQGKIYDINPEIQNMSVPHRSLWLLQNFNIKYSQNEMIAIMIHDGMYDDGNVSYFKSYDKHRKMHNHMPLLLHHADHMASQIEYEHWKSNQGVTASMTNTQKSAVAATAHKPKKVTGKVSTSESDAQELFKGLFGDS